MAVVLSREWIGRGVLASLPSALLLSVVALGLLTCGPSGPQRAHFLPEAGVAAPVKPGVEAPRRRPDLPEVALNEEFEIRGFSGVLLRGHDLELGLKRVRWSEMQFGERAVRHGWAELTIRTEAGEEDVRVDTDDWHAVGRFEVGVLDVGEFPGERTARIFPWARLQIRLRRGE